MTENVPTKTMNSKICLSGMEFYAHHGCFEEEQQVGTHFKVDLVLEYDGTLAGELDDIKEAVNYQKVYLKIKEIMQMPVNLLETVCVNILEMLKKGFPQVLHAEVTVWKLNPAIGGKVKAVGITEQF